jgi:uncharacterized protein
MADAARPQPGPGPMLAIEVCRVDASGPTLVHLALPAGATVADAVAASGLAAPGAAPGSAPDGSRARAYGLAVHGRRVEASRTLADGDRVDLLAPLLVDPKVARQRRAEKRRRDSGDVRWSRRD